MADSAEEVASPFDVRCVTFSDHYDSTATLPEVDDSDGGDMFEDVEVPDPKTPGRTKRGKSVRATHPNFQLTVNMMQGIRYSVGHVTPQPSRELEAQDFVATTKVEFPKTALGKGAEFKDYAPMVFRHLRDLFAIDAADYMLSICGDEALSELLTPGKSGSFFYYSYDGRYMIKTVSQTESKLFRYILPQYYQFIRENPQTLLSRFYGLHRVKQHGGRELHFCIMGNVFHTDLYIHRKYDLKGSTVGRTAKKGDGQIDMLDPSVILKDLDIEEKFHMGGNADLLKKQIRKDAEFLAKLRIMDYSLLVGIHEKTDESASSNSQGGANVNVRTATGGVPMKRRPSTLRLSEEEMAQLHTKSHLDQHHPVFTEHEGGVRSQGCTPEKVYFFGIIDILQEYNLKKQMESGFKSLKHSKSQLSAIGPGAYAERFVRFLEDKIESQ